MIRSIGHAYSQALFKIFQTFDKNIIKMCQYYMYLLPIELKIVLKKLKFFSEIKKLNNMFISVMHMEDDEFLTACSLFVSQQGRTGVTICGNILNQVCSNKFVM